MLSERMKAGDLFFKEKAILDIIRNIKFIGEPF